MGHDTPAAHPETVAATPDARQRQTYTAQDDQRRAQARSFVRRAVLVWAVASVGVLITVGLLAVAVADRVAAGSAVREAGDWTHRFARLVVAPRVTDALRRREPGAVGSLDEVVRVQMTENSVLRVKVWSSESIVLYSDENRLLGRRYPLDPDDLATLESGGVHASVSQTSRAENEFETAFGRTVEVYAGVRDTQGRKVLVEAYLPVARLEALRDDLRRQITLVVVLSLLSFELLLLPLAVDLARRIQRHQEERTLLSRLASEAAAAERRALAAELHDGVIQDLAGVAFALGMVRTALDRAGLDDLRGTTERLNDIVKDDVGALRGMLGSLTLVDFADTPLREIVDAAAAQVEATGLRVRTDLVDVPGLPRDVHTALTLVAREALRNVVAHARAASVDIRLGLDRHHVVLRISDDGVGFDPVRVARAEHGHLGLTLYGNAAQAAGGRYTLRSAPGAGTTVDLQVPLPRQDATPRWWLRLLPRRDPRR